MSGQSRRTFLKSVALAGAGLLGAKGASASEGVRVNDDELGLLYDATKCVGCKACMAACKRVNGQVGGLSYEHPDFDKDKLWDAPQDLSGNTRSIIKLYREGDRWSYVQNSCMHCQRPSCVSVCPVGAMTKDKKTGIVANDKDTCIGCRYCQVACAFTIPKFQWDKAIPRIVKCDFCKDTNLVQKGITACAETCPAGALKFGKRKDLLAEARKRIADNPQGYVNRIYGEKEGGGTNHLYLAKFPFEKLGLPSLNEEAPAEFSEKVQHTIYKGFVAPFALYGTLCFVAVKNMKKQEKDEEGKNSDPKRRDG